MATIRDLANYTGFSTATISRVLSNDPTMSVTEGSRTIILDAARKLNYTPSKARRDGKPRAMHIAIAEMLTPAEQLWEPYYLFLKNFVLQSCVEMGISVSHVFEQNGSYQALRKCTPDGILAIGTFSEQQVKNLSAICPRIVFLDSAPDELRFDSVVLNFQLGVEQALEYLIQQGHRRIGFLGPTQKMDQQKRPAPEVRQQIFIEYMKSAGLYEEGLVIDTKVASADRLNTIEAVGKWMKSRSDLPTAFLTYNEATALTAVAIFRENGVRIPEDVSLVSFDDTPLVILMAPPLTSINARSAYMAEVAVKQLIDRIEAPEDPPRKIVVPPVLTERSSVLNLSK